MAAGRAITRRELGGGASLAVLAWRAELAGVRRAPVLVSPTLRMFAPGSTSRRRNADAQRAINLAGHPALALPVPAAGPLPASMQLVGPDASEALLLATGQRIEAAVG